MRNSDKYILTLFGVFITMNSTVQALNRKVLFLGNSYTYVNNLPQIIGDFAASMNDTLIFNSHTPGGYTLDQHFADTASTNKIIAGGWDYVVMQEQSQLPALMDYYSNGGSNLCHMINLYNPCARKMFYMTWGRKNGDASNCASWPPICTYAGMDSLLRMRYIEMAMLNNAELSPVGAAWNYLRQNYPAINLYSPDESHPSIAGSYAAAACFYAVLFRKNPALSTFRHSLDSTEAAVIRQVAKMVVYDSLGNWDYSNNQTQADFSYSIGTGSNEVIISNRTVNADYYYWDWGDGTSSTIHQPVHNYGSTGTFLITLTATNCDLGNLNNSLQQKTVNFCLHNPTIFPDSLLQCPDTQDTLWTQVYDSYQWLDAEANPLSGDTNRYIIPSGGYSYSVQTTLNQCTERSPSVYVNGFTPGIVIYRVDSVSNSIRTDSICLGDTVRLILQPNKPAGNDFYFQWYKNGIEIPFATDDTLIVISSGDYQVKVHNLYCPSYLYYQNSPLPLTFLICNIGIDETLFQDVIQLYPNPAAEIFNIKIYRSLIGTNYILRDLTGKIVMKGKLEKEITSLPLGSLTEGIYFFETENTQHRRIKLIRTQHR